MDIEGAGSVNQVAPEAQSDPYQQLKMPERPDEEAKPPPSSNASMGNSVTELAVHLAGGAVDMCTYGSLIDGAVELGGFVLEGIGEMIAAIGDGL